MTSWQDQKRHVEVLGERMSYVERGEGRPILFLHGNPTSSYLWRTVMPQLEGRGRCIAPDLIGMGDSAKLPNPGPETYRFHVHAMYLDGFIDAVIGTQEKVVLVAHDWGTALGFDWAHRNPERVEAIAYMEGFARPVASWEEWNKDATPVFQGFRSEAGEGMVLDKNLFIERVLPGSIVRTLSDQEIEEYRRPFKEREDRWPTLTWPREIPVAGEPADVHERLTAVSNWMADNEVPKLFVNAEPGAIMIGKLRDFCRSWINQHEVTVPGIHFIQEDSGPQIGQAIAQWLRDLDS
ncbi:haloalkane dehalogenase [Pseudovibrio exalbescens]|uniref:haloalkane dehalogenase n=1 Tax=Pseudovibrio exalbescens TaxID=197461 RepID=UPI0023659E5F|nr:haloalkane dehalogenase [Pseudovibrio exalbescens]MDD7910561.1 haloalkane dehalogenase [Pseudovibrio exalbescens]